MQTRGRGSKIKQPFGQENQTTEQKVERIETPNGHGWLDCTQRKLLSRISIRATEPHREERGDLWKDKDEELVSKIP